MLHSQQDVEWILVTLAGLVGWVAQFLLPVGLLHGHHQVCKLVSLVSPGLGLHHSV